MVKTLKAISKQFFGAKYESLKKSLLICSILFFSLYATEIKLIIAPYILYLVSSVFTASIMWQALSAQSNAETMQGVLMLPFENCGFVCSYVFVLASYTIITKTLLVWSLFFAVGKWEAMQLIAALVCSCNACLVSTVAFILFQKRNIVLPLLWIVGIICIIFIVRRTLAVLTVALISFVIAALFVSFIDAYTFYNSVLTKKTVRHTGNKGRLFVYFIRYLQTNRNYLFNTLGLCVVACFLPSVFGQFREINILPIGFAILSLNTPICTLLSCDTDLEQSIRVLPRQTIRFCSSYCVFIGIVNFSVICIYLFSWQVSNGGVNIINIWTAVLFSLQSAILSACLEWGNPIHNWKIESDLWHHPRKYIVPFIMILLAIFVATWISIIWIWSVILLMQCCFILYMRRL